MAGWAAFPVTTAALVPGSWAAGPYQVAAPPSLSLAQFGQQMPDFPAKVCLWPTEGKDSEPAAQLQAQKRGTQTHSSALLRSPNCPRADRAGSWVPPWTDGIQVARATALQVHDTARLVFYPLTAE